MMEALRTRTTLAWMAISLLLLILPACSDDGDSSPDGDNSDGDELDGDSLDLDGDSSPDGDNSDGDEDLDNSSEEEQEEAEAPDYRGTRHHPCFDDGTCKVGLLCEEGICEADPEVTWVPIPGGTFWMGCGGEGTCTPENMAPFSQPRHEVRIPAFEMTQTEITELQVRVANGYTPLASDGNIPFRAMNFQHAERICEDLGSRLPSEAEWEYAARAGTETDYYCGNDQECLERITWYCNGEPDYCFTRPVGEKEPNAFGLYDMIGNAAEFVADTSQGGNYTGAPTDGSAWVVEENSDKRFARSGYVRDSSSGTAVGVFKVWLRGGIGDLGIRCARDLQEEGDDAESTEDGSEQED